MSTSLPDIGHVATAQVDGLQIRLARSGQSGGIPILLTSPWPESIYAFRGILPALEALGPLIAVDLPGFGRSGDWKWPNEISVGMLMRLDGCRRFPKYFYCSGN